MLRCQKTIIFSDWTPLASHYTISVLTQFCMTWRVCTLLPDRCSWVIWCSCLDTLPTSWIFSGVVQPSDAAFTGNTAACSRCWWLCYNISRQGPSPALHDTVDHKLHALFTGHRCNVTSNKWQPTQRSDVWQFVDPDPHSTDCQYSTNKELVIYCLLTALTCQTFTWNVCKFKHHFTNILQYTLYLKTRCP